MGAIVAAAFATFVHAQVQLDTSLRAFDPLTGKSKWIHTYQGTDWNPPRPELLGGLLSTAGRLVFAGAPGNFIVAYDPSTGRQLWHAGLTAPMSNTPITYMLNGRQQLVVAAGDTLYAFSLQP